MPPLTQPSKAIWRVACAASFCWLSASVFGSELSKGIEAIESIQRRLESTRIPLLQFRQATLEEAVEFVRMEVNHPHRSEVIAHEHVNLIVMPGIGPSTAEISLDFKDVPAMEALRYIAELSGCKLSVEAHAVVLRPTTESVCFATRVYKLKPEFASQLGSAEDARPALSKAGIELPESHGSAVYYREGAHAHLVVRLLLTESSASLIEKIESWLIEQSAWAPSSLPTPVVPTKPEKMAQMLIVKQLDLLGVTLEEAVNIIRDKAAEASSNNSGFVIKVDSTEAQDHPITLVLKDIPVFDALRYCAEMSGGQLHAEGDILFIIDKGPLKTDK